MAVSSTGIELRSTVATVTGTGVASLGRSIAPLPRAACPEGGSPQPASASPATRIADVGNAKNRITPGMVSWGRETASDYVWKRGTRQYGEYRSVRIAGHR